MLHIKEITSQKNWNSYVDTLQPDTFLHTWEWKEFQEHLGKKTWSLGLYEGNKLEGICLVLKITARRGTFLFCPHGPHIQWENKTHRTKLMQYLKDLAVKEDASFIRFSPTLLESEESQKMIQEMGFRDAPMHMHSELTWILDIQKDDDELMKAMRKVHRYSIRKSGREGVEIEVSNKKEDISKFLEIYNQTVSRQGFNPFSKQYFEKEFEIFSKENKVRWFFAKYNDEIVATAMIIFSNGSAYYHHGASIHKYPKIPAPHLLQWEIIQEAKRRGCTKYNFWGIAPADKPKHPWKGLTFFKTGFGGEAHPFLHAQDYIITPKYWVNWIIETVRRIKRGY